jgi:fatty acid desaturase
MSSVRREVEWPTVAVGALIASGWLAALAAHDLVGPIVFLAVTAWLGAWYMSFQHEAVHGHPFADRWLCDLVASAPLSLWLPYARYRDTHRRHHDCDLTDPRDDPESWYVTEAEWRSAGAAKRAVLLALRTLAGRLVLGPIVGPWRFVRTDLRAMATGDRHLVVVWLRHLAAAALVVVLVRSFGVPLWEYVLGFVFGGGALTALRSFAEHRYGATGSRSAVVEAGPVLSLLYLNNNLHHTHHALPAVAWYRLPQVHALVRGSEVAARGAGLYRSYHSVLHQHVWRAFDQPVHPREAVVVAE